MPLILPGNVASATASTAFNVDNSCRFNQPDSSYMSKTSSSVAEKKIGTISFWLKRGNITTAQTNIITHNSTGYCLVALLSGSQIRFYSADHDLSSTQVLRDTSAWYHIFVTWDTTQGTASNRAKLYVNGVQVTLFATETYPDEDDELAFFVDSEAIVVGANSTGANYFDGYLAEVVALEGTAAAVTDFGEFDEDSPTIWKPIEHAQSGNKGANGFHLDFKASGNLGNDAYGGTDFTETNLVAADQAVDTPTNNFCVWNPQWIYRNPNTSYGGDYLQGNVHFDKDDDSAATGSMVVSAGKWYMEFVPTVYNNYTSYSFGMWNIAVDNSAAANNLDSTNAGSHLKQSNNYTNSPPLSAVRKFIDGTGTSHDSATIPVDTIVGMAANLDDNEISFYKDGSIIGSAFALTANRSYVPFLTIAGSAGDIDCSFGGCPSFTVSSAAADENGYGIFEIAPPSGFLAMCSKNLGSTGY